MQDRADVAKEYRWDLSPLYEDRGAWEKEADEARDDIAALQDLNDVSAGADLLTLLRLQDQLFERIERLSSYTNLKVSEETTNQEFQALRQQIVSLASRAGTAASFIDPLIQALGRERVQEMVQDTPKLGQYEHYLDDVLRLQPHTLPREQESLLATLSEVLGGTGQTYSMLVDADFPFPEVETPDGETVTVTQNTFPRLLQHPDRKFRQTVYEQFYDTYGRFQHTITAAYENRVRTDVVLSNIRQYGSARESALDDANIPITVYDTLVDTITDNLSLLHDHMALKQEVLEIDTMQMWDIGVPLVRDQPTIPYSEAQEHVLAAIQPMGEDYVDRVRTMLQNRRIDVYETKNKRSGAFSAGPYPGPSYILMNYQQDVQSMYTLAHEMGHAMHSELTNEQQPYVYSHYPIFTAEIASTVNEALLTRHLLAQGDEELQRQALNQFLEEIRATIYRQTLFAAFEQQVHETVESGEALTTDRLNALYRDLKKRFYAPVVADERIAREWMRIPHFYSAFYVYQYATGMSAALALSQQILVDGPDAYLKFLKQGAADYPLNLLQDAGVDLTTPAPIKAALDTYEEHLDRMAALHP